MPRRGSRRRRVLPAFEPMEPRLLLAGDLLITEFMAANTHTYADHEGDSSDWIEIHNRGAAAADLGGLHLTDTSADLTRWEFPAGVSLGPGDYLVVFASGKDRVLTWTDGTGMHTEYHTSFKLDAGGGYLALIDRDGVTPIARYSPAYPAQIPDVSYGLPAMAPPAQTPVVPGANARYLVPDAQGDLAWNWNQPGFDEAGWLSGTTGLGYDAYAVPASPGAGTFYYGPFGPNGSWHLYEVITTTTTWIAAYNAAKAKVQSGVPGHLVTITSAAEHQFVRSIITANSWLGLTDSDTFAALGAHEYVNTSTWGAPTEGQVPASNQRGAGFVWVTGEPFTYHLNVWAGSQPSDSSPGQDAGMIQASDGLWTDERNGEGSQTGTNRAYVIEYDLNLASMGPAFTVLRANSGTALNNITDGVNLLNAAGGMYYSSPFINFIDPQSYSKGRFGGCMPFGGDDPSQADTNFAVRVTGTVRIPATGTWTFGVNSDDGFRLKIDGAAFTNVYGSGTTASGDTMEYAVGRARGDSLGLATLSAGDHAFELNYYQGTGGSGLEFFAASGSWSSFNANFKLVGDTRSGGLALVDVKDLVSTDIQAAMKGVNASAFLRIPFTVGSLADVQYLTLRMRYDDGFVAYINGHEAWRVNAPETPAWNSAATAEHPDSQAIVVQDFDISDMIGSLETGTNVLAIQGLNASAGDGDFLVLPELTLACGPTYIDLPRYFVAPTPGGANGSGTADLGPIVTDVSQPATAPGDNDPIVVTAKVLPSFDPVIPATVTLHYRVMWNSEVALTMYDDGAHGDGAAGDYVYGATIGASASVAGQMVRWYVTAADAMGRTGRWPLFEDQGGPAGTGSPEYLGTMIADPAVASALPVFYWFVQDPAAAANVNRSGTDCSVYYDGEFYDNLFVRIRGGTAASWPKHHYRFEFNEGLSFRYAPDQPRVDQFNLNSTYSDKAYLRAVLAWETYRDAGVPYCASFPMRVQQNGAFFSVALFLETVDKDYLRRQGMDPQGARYKLASDMAGASFNAGPFEKPYPLDGNKSDLQALVDGLNYALTLAGDARSQYLDKFLFNVFDVPEVVNYWAVNTLIHDNDDAQKNYYLYCDTYGTGQWRVLPWDKDLTFGRNYGAGGGVLSDGIWADHDPQSHPLFGDSEHPKFDGAHAWNTLIDAFLDTPAIREMYLRRLRTLMDKFLQAPGTPAAELYYESRIDELYNLMLPDVLLDRAKWGNPYGEYQDFATAIGILKTQYLAVRRTHLYVNHSQNAYYPDFAAIPLAELGGPAVTFGAFEYDPASGNQEEEYIELGNPNACAVDISGWRLTGGVDYTFPGGAVIPAGGSLYVSPNVVAFRARATSPKGNEGLFVLGNFDGHLTQWGETVRLLDDHGCEMNALAYTATPSDAQRYLRVTEVMYHPLGAPQGSGFNNDDYEYIELQNIGPAALDLAGVKFAEGVLFDFTGSNVTSLAPGAYALVVGNTAAFQSRYGHAWDGQVAGRFAAGNLASGGEQVRLLDARNDTILSFTYGDNWYYNTDGEGFSLTVRDPLQDRGLWNSEDGWRPSRLAGGSPGAADADLAPGAVEITEVLAHQDLEPPGDWIELANTTAAPIDLAGWFLSDDPLSLTKYRITADSNHPGTVIQPGQCMVFTESADFGPLACPTGFALSELGDTAYLTSVVAPGGDLAGYREKQDLRASESATAFTRYTKSTGGVDFVAESAQTPGADNAYPLVGPVIFNEIMYHPPRGGDEFIELRNITGADVLLYDPAKPANTWKFTDGITFAFANGDTIPANGYALVVPIAPGDFRTKYGIPPGVPIFGPYSGALANNGETLELSKPESGGADVPIPYYRVDRLTYNDGPTWPIPPDGFGPSLARKVAAAYGNDVANWGVGNNGGTPGAANRSLDATPPTTPTDLVAVLTSPTQIDLVWSAAADAQTGVACYDIYASGAKIATSTGTAYSFKSVWPAVSYSFRVSAVNGDTVEGGLSEATPVIRVVTLNSAKAADAATVHVTFSEAMNRDSAQVTGNYTVLDGGGQPLAVTQAILQPGQKTVALTLAAPLSQGVTYTAKAANLVTKTGFTLLPNSQATFFYTPGATGSVLREYWLGISGGTVADLTDTAKNPNYPDNPTGSELLTSFEAPKDWGDSYGQCLRAYVTAPTDGPYTFWIASDDAGELWLSTDDRPANVRRIAYVPGYTNSREWTTYTQQCSTNVVGTINLVAGQRYYIEALMKEDGGGDNLCVRWQLPSTVIEEPIPAGRLTAFVPTPDTTVSIRATAPTASELGPVKGTLTITRSGGSTARALTVYYVVTGTASTADFQEDLTGIAEVPAGASSATIDITPSDDHRVESDETVCLALLPDRKYVVGTPSATVTILDNVAPPTVIGIAFNDRAGFGPSAVDPSGRGVETITITFSESMVFAAGDVVVETVTFDGLCEHTAPLTPQGLSDPGSSEMRITFVRASVVDTWVKVTLKESGTLKGLSGRCLDGEPKAGGSGRTYIYDASKDLPTGDGTAGGDAIFYVGSLRGDFVAADDPEMPRQIAEEDIAGFLTCQGAGEPDADFRGVGFAAAVPDDRITPSDIDGFLSAYQTAVAEGRHLDPLPTPGPTGAGEPGPLGAGSPDPVMAVMGDPPAPPAEVDVPAPAPVDLGRVSAAALFEPAAEAAGDFQWTSSAATPPGADETQGTMLSGLSESMAPAIAAGGDAAAAGVPLAAGARAAPGVAADPVLSPDGGLMDLLALPALEVPLGA